VTEVWARIDRGRVREHVVDANDGIIASAGIVEGLLGAGASSTILLVASLAAMIGGGLALAACVIPRPPTSGRAAGDPRG
jgi:hypothetical protein